MADLFNIRGNLISSKHIHCVYAIICICICDTIMVLGLCVECMTLTLTALVCNNSAVSITKLTESFSAQHTQTIAIANICQCVPITYDNSF